MKFFRDQLSEFTIKKVTNKRAMSSQVVFMMGISQQQQLEAMPDGMAKRILLKIINAPKAPVEKLEYECRDLEAQYLKDHNLTELPR